MLNTKLTKQKIASNKTEKIFRHYTQRRLVSIEFKLNKVKPFLPKEQLVIALLSSHDIALKIVLIKMLIKMPSVIVGHKVF